ncbi:hypothetical protein DXT99_25735 [Pontibacter diazotrophicus]|uniref:Orphan protein n=1 Tax=Pontibacter diazotrophicus TaxID=1400979 RepID=A0A3D8KZX3_9BACT|nr:DUF6702 family protein [Pontibacter diazotrophicus]RDV10754.1 hypothetical protein DXT99_25735 [Pontibacter diazotrophicus]
MKYKVFSVLLLLLAFLATQPASAHDYHASITDVKYNPRTQSLEVAVKVFMDDLENALSRQTNTKVTYSSNSEEVKKYISDYLQKTLSFELEKGKPLKSKLLGSEEDVDVVWMYVEVPVQKATLAQLYVKNAILTDLFTDQMNIVNIDYKGETESVLMQRGDVTKKLTF